MTLPLFAEDKRRIEYAPGAIVLEGFALQKVGKLLEEIDHITSLSPFRKMQTPNGYFMSVGMTNCGKVGWVSDRKGYRYEVIDPMNGKPWPALPDTLRAFAQDAAKEAGYDNFSPDMCLMNCYEPKTKLSLHSDYNEPDDTAPIVSVSLGLPATFLFGGRERKGPTIKVPLYHGDVFVFGGASRRNYHGIAPMKMGEHSILGAKRLNLTFRKAL